MPLPPPFEARLVGVRSLTPSVRELAFERVDGQAMAFEPGQFCNVLLPPELGAGGTPHRSYSFASSPDGSPRFEVAVTRVEGGPGSTWIHSLQAGALLKFTGPQGFFTRAAENPVPSLMIATGTGVTPMRSMIRAAIDGASGALLWLVLGVRTEQDLLYAEEFRQIARAHAFIRFEPTLSRPHGDWAGRRGYVQTHVRDLCGELATASGAEPHVYVCGLERMVASVRDLVRKQMALPRERVHSERYD
jgi:CDP-4-dehydro-6-deoxyglucose reductase